jgi:hypothetical protein
MSDERGYEEFDAPPDDAGPVAQERAKGHALLGIGHDVYVEVSTFKGKTYASMRRWFQADDGAWYRTKNGLSMEATFMHEFMSKAPIIGAFIEDEAKHPFSGSGE